MSNIADGCLPVYVEGDTDASDVGNDFESMNNNMVEMVVDVYAALAPDRTLVHAFYYGPKLAIDAYQGFRAEGCSPLVATIKTIPPAVVNEVVTTAHGVARDGWEAAFRLGSLVLDAAEVVYYGASASMSLVKSVDLSSEPEPKKNSCLLSCGK